MFRLPLSALALALVTLAGCSASSTDDPAAGDDQEANGAKKLIEAKLYDDPRATPNASCDRHTALTVQKERGGLLTVKLEDKLSATSTCEIFVSPNPRSFKVTESKDCGSTIYTAPGLRVQDNRTRLCEDIRPSVLEVDEGGRRLYGKPNAAPAPGGGAPVSKVLDVKLYEQPKTRADNFCDHYLKLTIGKEGSKLVASLKNELSPTSACEIAIQPNERTYDLVESSACGSKIYEGTKGDARLRVQDNRTRLCEDLRPDVVEVTESNARGSASYFGAP